MVTSARAIVSNRYKKPKKLRPLNFRHLSKKVSAFIDVVFSFTGRQFDAIGNLRDWWDGKVKDEFEKRAQCVIDQYKKELPETGLHVNGKLTQGENIADNGGVKQASKAYKEYLRKCGEEKRTKGLEKYNNEQMFFIGDGTVWCGHSTTDFLISLILTDPHAPEKYRSHSYAGGMLLTAQVTKPQPRSPGT